jgi:cytochrome c nitrite reductase small subunit
MDAQDHNKTSYFSILAMIAAILSLGYFTIASDAAAYGGNAPETCANCHVMDSQYENWYRGGHGLSTRCTDCHLPHDNIAVYYAEKGRQGMKDTLAFISGNIPVSIRANQTTKEIIQENCIHCHEETVDTVIMGPQAFDQYCWDCHRSTAHGDRGGVLIPYQDAIIYPIQ